MDLNKYWRTVRSIERSLPADLEHVHLVSLANENTGTLAGKTTAAPREYAARWLANGTHRLATEIETDAYAAEIKARTEAINLAELAKKQTVRLESAIPEEQLQRAVEAALAAMHGKKAPKAA